jgi:predicted metal-dependent HD superfamily phosphohydrolase
MNEVQEQILASARNYVTSIFTNEVKPEFVFHNLEHTEDVVEACSIMADHYHLEEEDHFVLMVAAWFHDTGYSSGEALGHEDVSIRQATAFLRQKEMNDTLIQRVVSCIQATRMPQSPVTQIEKILCDADLFHLSTEDFRAKNELLKEERENILGHKINKKEWRKNNIIFLKNHKYFTDYGQENLEQKKQDNLLALQKKKPKKATDASITEAFPYLSTEVTKESQKEAKNTERSVQTMFRIASSNHMRLSAMSDNKSHIMISVNSIIISVVLTVSIRQHLPYVQEFIYPICVLLFVCLGSMVFSVLATRPTVGTGQFTEEDIRNKKTNLLFFGNFYQMQLDDYLWAMSQMTHDANYVAESISKDIYFLGVVLAKKYKYLRISYTIFMWGLIAAVIAFAIAAVIATAHGSGNPQTVPVIDY